jgi:hypothetical protein
MKFIPKKTLARILFFAGWWLTLSVTSIAQNTDEVRVHLFPGTNHLRVDMQFDESIASDCRAAIVVAHAADNAVLAETTAALGSDFAGEKAASMVLDNLVADLWTPVDPVLYTVRLTIEQEGRTIYDRVMRTGFKSFTTTGGQLFLNGQKIFLRGIAINPPGRGIPADLEKSRAFAEEYVRFMLSQHVNVIRIPDNHNWYDVCDEMGMMVFGGNYSATVAGQRPPEDYDAGVEWYKQEKLGPISHHPSLIIYAMTNEVSYRGASAQRWEKFLTYAHKKLKAWDPDRLFIGNAGYGYGKSADICDLHRYWGWYYSSPFTFLKIRDNGNIIPFDKGVQPVTFTECVGNYSGPDGRYNLTPDHKNPVSQLCWTGHAAQSDQGRLASLHQCFAFKQATELFRRLRYINPELTGIFPFTTTFYNWHTVENFMDMDPKPVMEQALISYQPVLLSWELWQTQVYAGEEVSFIAHIVNDSEDFTALRDASLVVELRDKSETAWAADTIELPTVPYYGTAELPLSIPLPSTMPTGMYKLYGKVFEGSNVVSENETEIFIGNQSFVRAPLRSNRPILVYDPEGTTCNVLSALGYDVDCATAWKKPKSGQLLVIGENAAGPELVAQAANTVEFVRGGGRVLCLRQDSRHLPSLNEILPGRVGNVTMDIDNSEYPPPDRPSRNGFNINPERPGHPVFNGLQRDHFRVWSDYTAWNETQSGMPAVYPVTDGFILEDKADIAFTAVLANYSVGLEGVALAEMFEGKGSVMLCGFDLVRRSGIDPVADRLLVNLITHMLQDEAHGIHPLIDAPIRWGEYETEQGVLTGIYSGLMLNTRPKLTGSYREKEIVIHRDGHQFAERPGGWNNRAGIQYIPFGRRMFGPYYHRGFGGVPEPVNPDDLIGRGTFWCRVPEATTEMQTVAWNPADEPLSITISINDMKISEEQIAPSEYRTVVSRVDNTAGSIRIDLAGDRRLVIMETSFH